MSQVPEAILDSIEAMYLPSMPQILLQFLHVTEDDTTSIAELASLVGQDPALSARVLTIANSPAVRSGAESKNLLQCMANLGPYLLRTLATCLVTQKVFSPAVDNQKYDFTGFWGHSLRVAEVARAIAIEVKYPDAEEAYLSGLLHDVGQLLLLGGVGERYGSLLILSRDESDLQDLEEQRLGTDHAAIGAWLVDQWQLSSFMADSILFHHRPAEEIVTADALSKIVWSAHVICCHYKRPGLAQAEQLPDLAAIHPMLGLDVSNVYAIYRQCSERVASIAAARGITETADAKTLPYTTTFPLMNVRPRLNDNDIVHVQMEEMVRDKAIMQQLQQDLASLHSESEILLAVRESARILFGLGQLTFLLVQPDRAILSGASIDCQHMLLQRLEIPLDSKHSLAATVALENQPHSTFERQRPVVASLLDVQIARILGSAGLLYVPLYARQRNIGVMVCGVSAAQSARLQPHLRWMTSFAHMAAVSIETWRTMRDREQILESTLTKRFEQLTRKAIHEVGSPLSIIRNYVNIIRRKLPVQDSMLQDMDMLREEIDRVADIMRCLNNPAEEFPVAGSLNINNLIENMLLLYGESLFFSRGIAVEKTLDPGLPSIPSDRDSVKQILLNLWNNASEVLSTGDCFIISTQSDVNQNGRAYVEILLSDTGPGLPPDVKHRLFQPLDPDRRPGHSGIGLSIVAHLVELLEGRITCQSKAGLGTNFSILLPQYAGDKNE